MKSLLFIISVLLILGAGHKAVAAENLCEAEINPFSETLNNYDEKKIKKKDLIQDYHARRPAIYSICDQDTIRKFERRYEARIKGIEELEYEKKRYTPLKRKTLDMDLEDNALSRKYRRRMPAKE